MENLSTSDFHASRVRFPDGNRISFATSRTKQLGIYTVGRLEAVISQGLTANRLHNDRLVSHGVSSTFAESLIVANDSAARIVGW